MSRQMLGLHDEMQRLCSFLRQQRGMGMLVGTC